MSLRAAPAATSRFLKMNRIAKAKLAEVQKATFLLLDGFKQERRNWGCTIAVIILSYLFLGYFKGLVFLSGIATHFFLHYILTAVLRFVHCSLLHTVYKGQCYCKSMGFRNKTVPQTRVEYLTLMRIRTLGRKHSLSWGTSSLQCHFMGQNWSAFIVLRYPFSWLTELGEDRNRLECAWI